MREIVIDALDPPSLARFWSRALDGYQVRSYDRDEIARLAAKGRTPESDPSVTVDGPGPTLFFQEVSEAKRIRNRLHFDLEGGERTYEIERLRALGATLRENHATWSVLQDPEGNEFCVVDPVTTARQDHLGRLIDHVHVVVRDIEAAKLFYRSALGAIGRELTYDSENAFACDELFVSNAAETRSHSTAPHQVHLAFQAPDRATVERFFEAAIGAGGRDNGRPGERVYHSGYYAAFVLDPDGNNIEVVNHGRGRRSATAVVIEIDEGA